MSTHSVADNLLKFYSFETVELTRTEHVEFIYKNPARQ